MSVHLMLVQPKNKNLIEKLNKFGISYSWYENISRKELYDCYKECDILFFASTYEGFGVPILEAQSVGRPVITSNVASMPEVADKGAMIIDPYSINEIKEAINSIIDDEKLRINLIKNGLNNIKRFDPNLIANKYFTLYENIYNNIY